MNSNPFSKGGRTTRNLIRRGVSEYAPKKAGLDPAEQTADGADATLFQRRSEIPGVVSPATVVRRVPRIPEPEDLTGRYHQPGSVNNPTADHGCIRERLP